MRDIPTSVAFVVAHCVSDHSLNHVTMTRCSSHRNNDMSNLASSLDSMLRQVLTLSFAAVRLDANHIPNEVSLLFPSQKANNSTIFHHFWFPHIAISTAFSSESSIILSMICFAWRCLPEKTHEAYAVCFNRLSVRNYPVAKTSSCRTIPSFGS